MENTYGEKKDICDEEDHLHLRGEYVYGDVIQSYRKGSSPLTWRIPIGLILLSVALRIISTYVENTIQHLLA